MLSAMSVVQTQIDSTVKQEVDSVLSERGISISDAMRLILMQ
ncbi:MAG: type II toxin-antitoxin system RelB/DinJ family antitoxin, partial [Neisseriaceae bacterium]|nr:type II toxin-antitoxin system RelB/DinJ family antitoxin [Neisseriaceae bacterium]